MGKTYVVFVGHKPGVYDTWEEAQKQVNKFSGASYRSFYYKHDALKAFDSYMDKQVAASSSTCSTEGTSYASASARASASASVSSSASARATTQAEKIDKLKDAVANLVEMAEEIKRQIESLNIGGDD